MPVLALNNPSIVSVPKDFISALPSSMADNEIAAPAFRVMTQADFGLGHMLNGTQLAGFLGRSLATSTGWELSQIPALTDLTNTVMKPLNEGERAAIAKMFDTLRPVVTEALEPITEVISAAITAIPIIGWIARIGFLTWKNVKMAIKSGPITSNVALGYDRERDELLTRGVLNRIGDKDWTRFFAPSPGPFRWDVVAYTSSGAADGVQWGQLDDGYAGSKSLPGVDTFDDALGLLPGVGDIGGFWQSPRNSRTGGDCDAIKSCWAGREQVTTLGQLAPAATALSGQLWANMQLPTPALGCVDLQRLRDLWQDYGEKLTVFASLAGGHSKSGRGEWLTNQIRHAWNWYGIYGELGDVPKQYRSWELNNLIRYKIDKAWVKAAQSLQSHAGAYVRDDAPLVRGDPSLKMLLAAVKQDLIQGRLDVLQVDSTLVPDPQYRKAIQATQAKLKATVYMPSGGLPSGPQRTPTPGSDDAPDLPALPGSISGVIPNPALGFDIRHLAGIAVAGLGIGAATYYFDDDLRRIVSGLRARARR